jgi:phosphatidylinositol alpha-mannosyltransferase
VKIAFVSQAYYPRYGGVSENVAHSAAALAERGHEVTVITGRPVGVGHPAAEAVPGLAGLDRVRVQRFGHGLMIPFQGAFVDVVVGSSLRDDLERFWQREHFDVVHIHQPLTPTLPLLTTLLRPSPLIGTFHAAGTRSRLWEAFRPGFQWHFDRLDLRLAVSPSAASFMTKVYGEAPMLLPNGVDTRRFHPGVEPVPGAGDGRFTVLFVGRLDPRKGLGVLLKAWEQVVRELSGEARLNIVGSSALAPWIRSRVPPRLRSTITFAGAVSARDLPGWYAAADVFCSPAIKNESFGVVLLEAMASGLPVVCSDLPGYRAVCRPKVEGLLARTGDANALAAALTALARDPQLSRRLGRAGRVRAETFDWLRVGRELEGLYAALLSGRPVRVATEFSGLRPVSAEERVPATRS